MIGSLIGAGIGAAASIFGNIKASQAINKAKQGIEVQKAQNEAWYNRRYNEDATQRADVQRLLNKTEESIRQRNNQAAANAAVMGATEESVAASKAANAQALADTMSQVAANAEAQKSNIEATFQARNDGYNSQLNNMEVQKAGNIMAAAGAVGQAAIGAGSAVDDYRNKGK